MLNKTLILCSFLIGIINFSTFAVVKSCEVDIEEVSIKNHSYNDVAIRVRWTGSYGSNTSTTNEKPGELKWLNVRYEDFGQNGVDRITAIALKAFTLTKTCWISFEDDNIRTINLKGTRNQ